MREHAECESHAVVLEGQDARYGGEHDGPALLALLARQWPVEDDAVLDEVARVVVEFLAHAGEFQAGGYDQDAQEAFGEAFEQVKEGVAVEEAEEEFEGAKEDDGGAAARAEAVLGREAAGAVADGHGAKGAAEEVHDGDGKANGGD